MIVVENFARYTQEQDDLDLSLFNNTFSFIDIGSELNIRSELNKATLYNVHMETFLCKLYPLCVIRERVHKFRNRENLIVIIHKVLSLSVSQNQWEK